MQRCALSRSTERSGACRFALLNSHSPQAMNPKKLLLILIAIAAVAGVSIPATSDAGGYRSRIEGTCGYCNKAVYAFYKPIGYSRGGQASYNWVTTQHTSCRNNYYRNQRSSRSAYVVRSRPNISIGIGVVPRYYGGYSSYRGGYGYGGGYGGFGGYRSYGRGGYCR